MRFIEYLLETNVVPFPRRKRLPDPHRDEVTGLPISDGPSEQEWIVLDTDSGGALSYHTSERDANIAARKQRQWHHKNVEVQPLL